MSHSSASDETYDCDKIAKYYEKEWVIDDESFLNDGTYLKNNTNFKDFSLNRIWIYDTPLFGLHISFKNRFYNLCFDDRISLFGILIEEKLNNLVFHVITNVGKNRVYSISFNLKNTTEKPNLSFLSQTKIDNHYNWFVDKLTLKDAIHFHKSQNFEEWIKLYWRGKWYHVKLYKSDYN